MPNNSFSKTEMLKLLARTGLSTGLLARRDAPEFAAHYRAQWAGQKSEAPFVRRPLEAKFRASVVSPTRIILAGSAGGKVRSTATILAHAAMLCGLWCTQRDDYPTTVMAGHSVSEVILSSEEVMYTGIPKPDLLAVLTREGLEHVEPPLAAMNETGRVYIAPELVAEVHTRAQKKVLRGELARVHSKMLALNAVAEILRDTRMLPTEALEAAIRLETRPRVAAENLEALGR